MKIHGGNLGGTESTDEAFGEWARVLFLKDGTEQDPLLYNENEIPAFRWRLE